MGIYIRNVKLHVHVYPLLSRFSFRPQSNHQHRAIRIHVGSSKWRRHQSVFAFDRGTTPSQRSWFCCTAGVTFVGRGSTQWGKLLLLMWSIEYYFKHISKNRSLFPKVCHFYITSDNLFNTWPIHGPLVKYQSLLLRPSTYPHPMASVVPRIFSFIRSTPTRYTNAGAEKKRLIVILKDGVLFDYIWLLHF